MLNVDYEYQDKSYDVATNLHIPSLVSEERNITSYFPSPMIALEIASKMIAVLSSFHVKSLLRKHICEVRKCVLQTLMRTYSCSTVITYAYNVLDALYSLFRKLHLSVCLCSFFHFNHLKHCRPILEEISVPEYKTNIQINSMLLLLNCCFCCSSEYWWTYMRADSEGLHEIKRLCETGKLKIAVDKTFPITQVKEAHEAKDNNLIPGKVVLEFD